MEFKRKKIGIFDSGIGGFSILIELLKVLPGHDYYYLSDVPNAPYGTKSGEFIANRCELLSSELISSGVDLILVACNTATAEGIDKLRAKFDIPFVGVEPFVKSVESMNLSDKNLRAAVITTEAMFESKRFKSLLRKFDPKNKIYAHACPNLASLIEEAYSSGYKKLEQKIEAELAPLKNKSLTHLILGCTHYPLIAEKIESSLGLKCISPCLSVAKRVAFVLNSKTGDGRTELFFKSTDDKEFNSFDPALLRLSALALPLPLEKF